MKKALFAALVILVIAGLGAKVTLFLQLDKIAKEPRVKPEMKCEDGKTYEDDLLSIIWEPLADGFRFELTNKSNVTLTIPWDECTFTNEESVVSRVIHSATGKSLVIEAGKTFVEMIAPVDLLGWTKKGGWRVEPIFQEKWKDEEFAKVENKDLVYKVVMPIRKDRIKSVYHFYFKAFAK